MRYPRTIVMTIISFGLFFGTLAACAEATTAPTADKPVMLAQAIGLPTGTKVAQAGGNRSLTQMYAAGNILNPLPDEQITDRQPMIAVRVPASATNPDLIFVLIDGNDVTGEAAISAEYIFYTPAIPLKLGVHNVFVGQFEDVEKTRRSATPIERWQFSVVLRPTGPPLPGPKREEKPTTTGKWSLNYTYIDYNAADRVAQGFGKAEAADIKYKGSPWRVEAPIINPTLDLVHKHFGKTLTFHYDRSVEEVTGRGNDRIYLQNVSGGHKWIAGDFSVAESDMSEFSMAGVLMRGLKVDSTEKEGYLLTSFWGRTQDPQDGRYKRTTRGINLMHTPWKGHKPRLIVLRSLEYGQSTTTGSRVPAHDSIIAVKDVYDFAKRFNLTSELARDNHQEFRKSTAKDSGIDSAFRATLKYTQKSYELSLGRRTVGPRYNPTTLGTFVEKDREGSYGAFKFNRYKWWNASTYFDSYHDNLHHNTTTNDLTKKTTNSISSVGLTVGNWPKLTWRYNKLYSQSDPAPPNCTVNSICAGAAMAFISRNESANDSMTAIQDLPDLGGFNGNRIMATFSRYDIDRISFSDFGSHVAFEMRSGTRNFTFSSRYKDKFQLSYNTSFNKTFSSTFSYNAPTNTQTRSLSDSRSFSDNVGVQWNVVPFKFITTVNMRRSVRRTRTPNANAPGVEFPPTASPMENTADVQFLYYLTQKNKLTLQWIDYHSDFRTQQGRGFDETVWKIGYETEF